MEKPWLEQYEDGVPPSLNYPETSIWGLLSTSFNEYPYGKALSMTLRYLPMGLKIGVSLTYRQLEERIDRLATASRVWASGREIASPFRPPIHPVALSHSWLRRESGPLW